MYQLVASADVKKLELYLEIPLLQRCIPCLRTRVPALQSLQCYPLAREGAHHAKRHSACFSELGRILESRVEIGAVPLQKLLIPACMVGSLGSVHASVTSAIIPQKCAVIPQKCAECSFATFAEDLAAQLAAHAYESYT